MEDEEAFHTLPSCSVVQSLEYKDRCPYVRTTKDCNHMGIFANYIEILYCYLKPHNDTEQIFCAFLLMTICIIIYIVLGSTVENVFCPALKVVSKILGFNEHLAGVTLLAFGNGSPDLIATFSNLSAGGPMFPDLFGAGVYVVLFVAGLIFVLYPFELQWNNVLRDACFLSFGIIYVDYCVVSDGVVTRTEAILIMSVYILYLMVVLMELLLLKQSVKMLQQKLKDHKYATAGNLQKLEQLKAEAGIEILDRTSRISFDVERTRGQSSDLMINNPNKNLLKQCRDSLSPIQPAEWVDSSFGGKLYIIITAPVLFLLQLFIPVVDYERQYHGWSKLLNSLQIPWVPLIIVYVLTPNMYPLGVPLCCYTLLFTVPISLYMLFTTRTDVPPSYHEVMYQPYILAMALYGVASSVLIIYYSARESVEVLRVIGIMTNRSNSFLACTLQAWGNSIGDLVSTIALARHGYPRMGYAACFGGPFFNSISSFGGVFIYQTFRVETPITVPQGSFGENCVIFQFIATISVLVWSTLTNFSARRSIGVFNLILYAMFLTFVMLGEFEVIETFAPEKEEELIDT